MCRWVERLAPKPFSTHLVSIFISRIFPRHGRTPLGSSFLCREFDECHLISLLARDPAQPRGFRVVQPPSMRFVFAAVVREVEDGRCWTWRPLAEARGAGSYASALLAALECTSGTSPVDVAAVAVVFRRKSCFSHRERRMSMIVQTIRPQEMELARLPRGSRPGYIDLASGPFVGPGAGCPGSRW